MAASMAYLMLAGLVVQTAVALPAQVRGRQIIAGSEPLHVKGVNWNPVPAGGKHPHNVSFAANVQRDALLMQQAGINVVRTYEPLNDTKVLDVLWAHGIQVISTVWAKADKTMDYVERQVTMVKDHPAILMWSVGNEWNFNGCYMRLPFWDCLARVRQVVQTVKRLDSKHPVATVYGELPKLHEIAALPDIDVWGINYYNELSFGDLFDRWEVLSTAPMLLGEFGADAYDTLHQRLDEGAQAHATSVLAQQIVANSALTGGVCSGGLIFEFADEWWKDGKGSADQHDVGGFAPGGGPHPDRIFNEEWWGLVEVDRRPRPAYHAYAATPMPSAGSRAAPGTAGAARLSCTAGGCVHLPPLCHSPAECAHAVAKAEEVSTGAGARHAAGVGGAGGAGARVAPPPRLLL